MLHPVRRILVVICVGAIGATAGAELQNANINGTYLMEDAQRFVHPRGLSGDQRYGTPSHFVMQPYYRQCKVTFQDVDIPERPVPQTFSEMGRVFLSFYVAVPTWRPESDERFDLVVYADVFPVYRREFSEPGFHLCLADMGPWAGKEVSLRFNAGWIEGDARKVLIALPRLLAWHGPHQDGRGGIRARGSAHGFSPLSRLSESELDQYAKRVGVSFAPMDCEWLLVPRVDCLTPSTVLTGWNGNWERVDLQPGYHWLPIMFADGFSRVLNLYAIDGSVEDGPMDKIPNFLRYDAGRLYFIAESMTHSKQ